MEVGVWAIKKKKALTASGLLKADTQRGYFHGGNVRLFKEFVCNIGYKKMHLK